MLDEPDQLVRLAACDSRRARLHRRDGLLVGEQTILDAPCDGMAVDVPEASDKRRREPCTHARIAFASAHSRATTSAAGSARAIAAA